MCLAFKDDAPSDTMNPVNLVTDYNTLALMSGSPKSISLIYHPSAEILN